MWILVVKGKGGEGSCQIRVKEAIQFEFLYEYILDLEKKILTQTNPLVLQ